jgi:SWI/SNF-related matrix-associated actin-dependent regulator of chromatin subfamily A3
MVSVPSSSFTSNLSPPPGQSAHTVIDLTTSPSPSPAPRLPPPALPPPPQFSPSVQPITFETASLRTPVCIGRLDVTALILYPSPYLEISISEPSGSDTVWGPVRLQYERTPNHEDTVHIKTPNRRGPHGEILPGEDFAIVEQRVASVLGPMLGKGLIRVDSRIRKGNLHLPVLPLEVLVYTPKGNILVVGNFLRQSGLLLEHPIIAPTNILYHNPHNPPPGGHARALMAGSRTDYYGPGGNSARLPTPVSGKTVEVQRAQVDELFKNLRGGEELEETEPRTSLHHIVYFLFDCPVATQLSKSERFSIHIRRKP